MRFRLRTILIAVAILSLALGWAAHAFRQAHRQKQAVNFLQTRGAEIYYDYEIAFFERNRHLKAPNGWTYARLRRVAKDSDNSILTRIFGKDLTRSVTKVYVGGMDDADCSHLCDLPRLRVLELSGGDITDAATEHLRQLDDLRELYLVDTNVTQTALDDLATKLSLKVAETRRDR